MKIIPAQMHEMAECLIVLPTWRVSSKFWGFSTRVGKFGEYINAGGFLGGHKFSSMIIAEFMNY